MLFTSNFLGIVFARSLHFQFYVWYFHQLPFLLFHHQRGGPLLLLLKCLVLVLVEGVWNVFPSNFYSSLVLQACHLMIMILLLFPGGATLGWWIKAVQLDLEARGLVVRSKGSPVRLYKN